MRWEFRSLRIRSRKGSSKSIHSVPKCTWELPCIKCTEKHVELGDEKEGTQCSCDSSQLVPIKGFCPGLDKNIENIQITWCSFCKNFHFINGEIVASSTRWSWKCLSPWGSSHPEGRLQNVALLEEHCKLQTCSSGSGRLYCNLVPFFQGRVLASASILVLLFQLWAPDTLTKI